jgi:hypothetical protein
MIDARIPVKIVLKGHFGSMLVAMGLSASLPKLERTSLVPLDSSTLGRIAHDNSPFPPWIRISVSYLD